MELNQYFTGAVITSVIMVCIFAYISVAVWAENRRREREAFYRSEVLKKLADSSGGQAQQVIDLMREQARMAREDAYALMSLACDLHISQMVNGPCGVHAMIPKAVLPA